MALCVYVIINGVKDGIENWSKIMMPIIIILLAVLAVRGLTIDGGFEGLKFLFIGVGKLHKCYLFQYNLFDIKIKFVT